MVEIKGVVMEGKERYEIHIYDDICVDLYNNGVLDKSINDTYKLEDLLNQQSKRIKELEQENLSLQEQSIRDNQNWIEETTQLKQQLNDFPKKIVEEIRDFAEKQIKDLIRFGYYANERNRGLRPINYYDLMKTLNTILKKYGGEDE